jgi:hypothetical protein
MPAYTPVGVPDSGGNRKELRNGNEPSHERTGDPNVRRDSGGLTDWEAAGIPLEGEWVA